MTNPLKEGIQWISVSERLPDDGSCVLACFERNDCIDRDVAIAEYDSSMEDEGEPCWWFDGDVTHAGVVMYWAEMPIGPSRTDEQVPEAAR